MSVLTPKPVQEAADVNPVQGLKRLSATPAWLKNALDRELILAALQRHVPEFSSGAMVLRGCKVKRLLLKDQNGRWVGTYTLTIWLLPSGPEQTVQLRGALSAPPWAERAAPPQPEAAFGGPGWRCYLPELGLDFEMEPPESELPAMPLLTDPEKCRSMLEASLQAGDPVYRDLRIQTCTLKVLSYKPGSRCTILYSLHYAQDSADSASWPRTIIAKTYRKASKARNAYEGMLALWRTPLHSGEEVTIAEPLAVIPEHKVMLQGSIPGEASLEDLLKSALQGGASGPWEEVKVYLRKTAQGLAAFHHSGVHYGETATWEGRIPEIHELLDRLAVSFPDLVQVVQPVLNRLVEYASAHPAGPPVPTHGTFNPEQVLIDGEKIGFIDFDDFCMAEPALDVGLFCSAIKDTGLNTLKTSNELEARPERYRFLERLGEIFIAEYETAAPVSRPRVALWQALDFLRNSLHYWIKVKPAEPDNALFLLEQQLQAMEIEFIH